MQAYQGHFENGCFYVSGQQINLPEKRQVILTILEEQEQEKKTTAYEMTEQEKERRKAWLEELGRIISQSTNEELLYNPRSTTMREPVNLTD